MADQNQYPVDIPATSRERYISFAHALNIRLPGEDTGDWHFKPMFFAAKPGQDIELAGPGQRFDTLPALGTLGVRDVTLILRTNSVVKNDNQVFAADHYRAIADMVAESFASGKEPVVATPRQINDWLDTPEQIATLRDKYLVPLMQLFADDTRERFLSWLSTVQYR